MYRLAPLPSAWRACQCTSYHVSQSADTPESVVLVFTNPISAIAHLRVASADCEITDSLISIDAHDYSVDMITDEAHDEPNPSVLARDTNSVAVELITTNTDLRLQIHWSSYEELKSKKSKWGVRLS